MAEPSCSGLVFTRTSFGMIDHDRFTRNPVQRGRRYHKAYLPDTSATPQVRDRRESRTHRLRFRSPEGRRPSPDAEDRGRRPRFFDLQKRNTATILGESPRNRPPVGRPHGTTYLRGNTSRSGGIPCQEIGQGTRASRGPGPLASNHDDKRADGRTTEIRRPRRPSHGRTRRSATPRRRGGPASEAVRRRILC